MVIRTPPTGFQPSTATSAALQEYGFPTRPSDAADIAAWQNALSAYTSSSVIPASVSFPSGSGATTYYNSNWAGFTAGQSNSQSNAFISVQADVTVPNTSPLHGSTYCFNSGQVLFSWIGLGGTYANNDLVQQGVECNDYGSGTNLPDTAGFHPFYEFANTRLPQELCGSSAGIASGHVLYEQESYETSSSIANFYMEDLTTGLVWSCSVSPPVGWTFDGNTADYIVEPVTSQQPLYFSFSSANFSDAQLEWGSDGDWVGFGTRPTTKDYSGVNSSNYCAGPSTIGSDNESFSVSYSSGDCGS